MPERTVIGPILLERRCDAGQGDMSEVEWAEVIASKLMGKGPSFMGCGTKFQWWFGSGCYCPHCGRTYFCDLGCLNRYQVIVVKPSHHWADK